MKYVQRLISDSHSESISLSMIYFLLTGQVNTKKGLIFFQQSHSLSQIFTVGSFEKLKYLKHVNA